MALDRLKSKGRGREGGFDVRTTMAIPEVVEKEDGFPQEALDSQWGKFFAYLEREAAQPNNISSFLETLLHLRLVFPEKRPVLDAVFETEWTAHKNQLLDVARFDNFNDAHLGISILYDLLLLDADKYQTVVAAWGAENIQGLISKQAVHKKTFLDIATNKRSTPADLAEFLKVALNNFNQRENWKISVFDIFGLSIVYPNFIKLLAAQDREKFLRRRKQILLDLENNLVEYNDNSFSGVQMMITSAAYLKLLYADGFKLTPRGLELAAAEKTPELENNLLPQPLEKDF